MALEQLAPIRAALLARRAALPPPLAARRAGFEAQMAALSLPAEMQARTVALSPTQDGLIVRLPESAADRMILWVHGGAFVLGSPASYRDFAIRLCRASGCPVLLPDYRLAPEHIFPAARDDVLAALDWLEGNGLPMSQVAIGGDSAGANLALAAVQVRLFEGRPVPVACHFVSPYLDLTHSGKSIAMRADRDPFVDPAGMAATAATYAGEAPVEDARVSPLFGAAKGLPPVLIQIGADEVLFDDAWRLAQRIWAEGGNALFQEWVGMIHVWPLFAASVDEGQWAIAQAGAFLKSALLGDSPAAV